MFVCYRWGGGMAVGKKVIICVLTYNNCQDTLNCLRSLQSLAYDRNVCRTVVVDNGSTDMTALEVAKRYPDVEIIRKETNTGAAAGRNAGIAYALNGEWEYIFFIDNDALVEPGTLGELIRTAESDPKLAAVGAITYYAGDRTKVWNYGGRVDWCRGEFFGFEQGVVDRGQYDSVREVDSFPIGFGIVRTEVIRKVGILDERYFIYYEEADWHARMRKAGYRLAVTPRAKIYHKVSSAFGLESPAFYYFRTRNRLLFMWKNAPRLQLALFLFWFLYDVSCHTMLTLYLSGKPAQMRGALLGVRDFTRGRFGKCPYNFPK